MRIREVPAARQTWFYHLSSRSCVIWEPHQLERGKVKTGAIDGGEGKTQHTRRLLSFYGLSGTNEEALAHRLFIHFVEEASKRKATARLLIVFSSISCYSKNDLRLVSKNVSVLRIYSGTTAPGLTIPDKMLMAHFGKINQTLSRPLQRREPQQLRNATHNGA